MKAKWFLTAAALISLALVTCLGYAQGLGNGEQKKVTPPGDVRPLASLGTTFTYQGRLLDAGNPANGTYDFTFALYDAPTEGALMGNVIWADDVSVTNGLFTVQLDLGNVDSIIYGDARWLEISVRPGASSGAYTTLTPRQELTAVPYAFSLYPGAKVDGSVPSSGAITAVNRSPAVFSSGLKGESYSEVGRGVFGWARAGTGDTAGVYGKAESPDGSGVFGTGGVGVYGYSSDGHGVYAESDGAHHDGAALQAENTHADGIAIWASNNSTDTTLVIENDGSGPLIKAFGGDGGEDEFRVDNDGTIETRADSYLWVPATLAVPGHLAPEDITIYTRTNGAVDVMKDTGSGTVNIYIPIAIPAVLYGQDVDVEEITIYYKCDSAASYITSTYLNKQTGASLQEVLITDLTNRDSTSDASYSLTPSPDGLSSDAGALNLNLVFYFDNSSDYIRIGGVRLKLTHHSLD